MLRMIAQRGLSSAAKRSSAWRSWLVLCETNDQSPNDPNDHQRNNEVRVESQMAKSCFDRVFKKMAGGRHDYPQTKALTRLIVKKPKGDTPERRVMTALTIRKPNMKRNEKMRASG
ncbi:hypothetical protein [Agrobacterium tumefaciens]|uniref:hypothetical protein n=1 Tax=Agrobacterium tumefaciens TaxID=358 RepID=UPI003B9E9D15